MINRYNFANKGAIGSGQAVYGNSENCAAFITLAQAIDLFWMTPILLPAGRLTAMSFEVTTGGGAGNKTRQGIFSNKRGDFLYPDKLLVESAEIDSTVTGIKNTTLALDLDEGLYWFALWTGAGTLPTYRSVPVGALPTLLGMNATPVAITGVTAVKTYNAGGFAANGLVNNTFPTGGVTSILGQALQWVTYSK
jgi:hypothetical protein